MRFDPAKCPECGQEPIGTYDTLLCRAEFEKQPDGSFEFSGNTEIFYDTQETEKDEKGRWKLECRETHTWFARLVKPRSTKRKERNQSSKGH